MEFKRGLAESASPRGFIFRRREDLINSVNPAEGKKGANRSKRTCGKAYGKEPVEKKDSPEKSRKLPGGKNGARKIVEKRHKERAPYLEPFSRLIKVFAISILLRRYSRKLWRRRSFSWAMAVSRRRIAWSSFSSQARKSLWRTTRSL